MGSSYFSLGEKKRLVAENVYLRDQNEQMVACIFNLTKILSEGVKPVREWEADAAQTTSVSENGDLGQVAHVPEFHTASQSPIERFEDGAREGMEEK